MTILIAGGAGFIGSNFVRDWLDAKLTNIVNLDKLTYAGNLDNLTDALSNPLHHFVKGDIADSALVNKLLTTYQPTAIINFAAESHVDRSIHGPEDFIQTNVVGTFRLLEAARTYWSNLPVSSANDDTSKSKATKASFRYLHISTDEVYGSLEQQDPAFTEKNLYQPNSPYSASKASSDHLVRAYHHTYGLPVLTTNCSNNYGPNQFPEKLIPLTIVNALAGRSLPIYGNGLQVRDWLYVADHCSAIRRVLQAGRVGETYNVGGLNEKTNIDIVTQICKLLDQIRPKSDGSSYANQITYVADRPGHDRRYAINPSKIANELNWMPSETFESGIFQTINWYLENSDWVHRIQSGTYLEWISKNYSTKVFL